jgi:hypothetical protein
MDGNQGFRPETLFQLAFNSRCLFMCYVQRKVSVHPDMGLDGYSVANAACTEMVGL